MNELELTYVIGVVVAFGLIALALGWASLTNG
jgi:hypothetical protein